MLLTIEVPRERWVRPRIDCGRLNGYNIYDHVTCFVSILVRQRDLMKLTLVRSKKQRFQALVRSLPDVDQTVGVDLGEAQSRVAVIER